MIMRGLIILMLSSTALFAGQKIVPVVMEFKVDTTIYLYNVPYEDNRRRLLSAVNMAKIFPVPLIDAARSDYYTLIGRAFLKKNSTQIDIVSFQGIIGAINIPPLLDTTINHLIFSQTFIDNDQGWEVLAVFIKSSSDSSIIHFTLFDDDGTIILSDEGGAYLGFDGNNTYVVSGIPYYNTSFKSWRFRTNISPSGGSTLKKTTSGIAPIMMTYGMSDGNYRVTLEPTSGSKTRLQLFDLVGRCIFSKQIDDISRPVSFMIPESSLPQTPFITKVSNSSGSVTKKEILVK